MTESGGLNNYLIILRPTSKDFRVNVRDNNRGVKGQNVKRLAQVLGFKTLSKFCVLFTQARFAIKSKMK